MLRTRKRIYEHPSTPETSEAKAQPEAPAAAPRHPEQAAEPAHLAAAPAPLPPVRSVVQPMSTRITDEQLMLISTVREHLVKQLDARFEAETQDPERLQQHIAGALDAVIEEQNIALPQRDRQTLLARVHADVVGLGPLEELLADDTVSEIMVNSPQEIFVERKGKLQRSHVRFLDDAHVRRVLERILAPLGRRVNESSPMVDARLQDGSRLNAVIPPIALNGSTLTIRKFAAKALGPADLIGFGAISQEAMDFLEQCVLARANVVVSGGTGSGKTTLLNVLSGFIPEDERIVTIENAAELQLQQIHVVKLEARPPTTEGRGEISIRDLVVNSLRMRPDRIVVGECRSGETLDMLQAMNTGHDGSMTTIHANTPRDGLRRLETMVLMSGMELPVRAIREQIASAVQLIAQLERFADGSRRVSRITEIVGMEGDVITMSDIYVFKQEGIRDGKIVGNLQPTGVRARIIEELERRTRELGPPVARH